MLRSDQRYEHLPQDVQGCHVQLQIFVLMH
jgi:hypothetical protein